MGFLTLVPGVAHTGSRVPGPRSLVKVPGPGTRLWVLGPVSRVLGEGSQVHPRSHMWLTGSKSPDPAHDIPVCPTLLKKRLWHMCFPVNL